MPVPIRMVGNPASDWNDKESHEMFLVNVDTLAGALGEKGKSASIHINAEATDDDAETLLDLFNRGVIVSEAEAVEDKKYAVPQDFVGDKLMRLKAASLVSGDTKIVRFTPKAVRVIKTLVLAEQNAYASKSVSKPYSVILAEKKAMSAKHSLLAFQKTAETIQQTAQSNREIPDEYMPASDSFYERSYRLIKHEGTANKQYIVRLFQVNRNGENPKWVVIAWNGRNQLGARLTMRPKGVFDSRSSAGAVFADIISSKQRSGYERGDENHNIYLLGIERPLEDSSLSSSDSQVRSTDSRSRSRSTRTREPVERPTVTENTTTTPEEVKPAITESPHTKEPKIHPTKSWMPEKVDETMSRDEFIDSLISDLSQDDDFFAP